MRRSAQESPLLPCRPRGEDDRDWWVRQVGRLKPGLSEALATAQINGVFRSLIVPEGTTIESNQVPQLVTRPGRRGLNSLNPRDATALWILMLLVAILLLSVCANVANLLLSRSVSRQRESAGRLALGGSRTRLLRQPLVQRGVVGILRGGAGP